MTAPQDRFASADRGKDVVGGADVVVGVSLLGDAPAVRWAATEARDRGVALRLVHGMVAPRGGYPGRSLVGVDARDGLFALARRELQDMRTVARGVAPDLPIVEDVVESDPVGVLRAQARVASLLVLGSEGFGPLGDLALGGVARGLAGRVAVPVVIVPRHADPGSRGRADAGAPVVVGDDGTTGSRGALRFAAARAASRRAALVVVRAGDDARLLSVDAPELGPERPAVVRVVVAEERADRVLADQARAAEIVVLGVGEHGLLGHRRRRIRPGLVRAATCPVVIVPPGRPVEPVAGRASDDGTAMARRGRA